MYVYAFLSRCFHTTAQAIYFLEMLSWLQVRIIFPEYSLQYFPDYPHAVNIDSQQACLHHNKALCLPESVSVQSLRFQVNIKNEVILR